jgi:hypothetical protein
MENLQLARTWTQMGHEIVDNNNNQHYKVGHILIKG